jgi:Protein of unknown function (DUF2855)
MAATAQVQPKNDFTKQTLVPFSKPLGPLKPNSVRVRTTLLSLTGNNKTYAIYGAIIGWWETYPVPEDFPSPYNDREIYGIVSGWGFATVEESNILEIPKETLIQGYIPLSSVPVDLMLTPGAAPGHWIEKSPHRAKLIPFYQRYMVSKLKVPSQAEREAMARDALDGTLWECSYLLNRFSFASSDPIINPAGENLPWTKEDADLCDATVVCLAGSGKTALALAFELKSSRAPGTGPRNIVAITSASNTSYVQGSKRYDTVLNYEQALADKGAALIEQTKGSKRIVMFDFGARGTFTPDVHSAITSNAGLPLTMIRVATESKVFTPQQLAGAFQRRAELKMVQVTIGEAKYFEELGLAKKKFFENGGTPGLKLKWYEGMTGPRGLEGAWENLCNGIPASEGIVVQL